MKEESCVLISSEIGVSPSKSDSEEPIYEFDFEEEELIDASIEFY